MQYNTDVDCQHVHCQSHPKWPQVITTSDHIVAHNFQTEIQKEKLKYVTPRHVQHTKHRTVQLRTATAADDSLRLVQSFRSNWLLYFIH